MKKETIHPDCFPDLRKQLVSLFPWTERERWALDIAGLVSGLFSDALAGWPWRR
jgi:hypothetical protein